MQLVVGVETLIVAFEKRIKVGAEEEAERRTFGCHGVIIDCRRGLVIFEVVVVFGQNGRFQTGAVELMIGYEHRGEELVLETNPLQTGREALLLVFGLAETFDV